MLKQKILEVTLYLYCQSLPNGSITNEIAIILAPVRSEIELDIYSGSGSFVIWLRTDECNEH